MRSHRVATIVVACIILLPLWGFAQIQERFPKPDFESGYTRPDLITPSSRSGALEYLDFAVLLICLSLATYFAHKLRSRRKIFLLMVFCLIYFGFYRKGCICPIGAIQNVSLAMFDTAYIVPLGVIGFFALPLMFALFFGRTFCAAVCPLGAVQDAVVLKPTPVRPWLAHLLGIFPYIYLGLAVLFAATGAGFIICEYDPFVSFFRFGASFNMIIFGASLLLLGTVVARPYCRFLCPYGVLLNWMSRLSKWHVKITPSECINCRLCEESCPFGAISKPTEQAFQGSRESGIRALAVQFLLLPIIAISSGWVVSRLNSPLAGQHPTVSLAREIILEDRGIQTEMTDETKAFRAAGRETEELLQEAALIQNQFRTGGWFLGGFLGLILSVKLINLSVFRRRQDFSVDRGNCLSCGRCFSYCPYEQVRLGQMSKEELVELETKFKQ
jgi:polyferredoxin